MPILKGISLGLATKKKRNDFESPSENCPKAILVFKMASILAFLVTGDKIHGHNIVEISMNVD